MSTIWTPAMVDTTQLADRLLVLGPRGFLATSDTVLFEKAWVSTLDLHVGSIHGVGYLNGSPIHMIQTASTQELPSCAWMSLRHLMLERDLETYKMLAYAAQVGTWSQQHRFCGACGAPTVMLKAERASCCEDCRLRFYPRISPCMIVLITRGEEVLLARSPSFAPGLYSTLAGFAEPGESMEGCVTREVREEVGIEICNLRYKASQSWPYPHSMMFGYHADYDGGEIVPQPGEIEDARWFNLHELPTLSSHRSISRYLIELFIAEMKGSPPPTPPQ
ncbi:NAD(+) diphosphatase [Pseudomonas sp. MM213]|uniref:NAD(+) diphosphatase n=1 Tax=Pseudomonas sp. MM213 TaxID=2866807 RepID=UPI001CF163E5|nr:NAD(+) diphosphatase [Pseudomonas sp. MM213]UCP11679.1 NAD(+) diphosphatase [Pseudomonas sp. MM213]